ncbi:MAG: DUF1318 domain-containing protein [Proteobacteria bacterium]|nr:DUF1318 domain-containing protein [Pseudomonadota bacterium]
MLDRAEARRFEAEQRVSAGQVGRVFAQQIMQKAPRGTPFLTESGRWTRK